MDDGIMLLLCEKAYAATDNWMRSAPDLHWVMDLDWYKKIRAAGRPPQDDDNEEDNPDEWVPDPGDQLFALPIEVREGGGEPHLETRQAHPFRLP